MENSKLTDLIRKASFSRDWESGRVENVNLYLTKEEKEEFDKLTDGHEFLVNLIKEHMLRKSNIIKDSLEMMKEEVLMYRRNLLDYKLALQEIDKELEKELQDASVEIDKLRDDMNSKIWNVKNQIRSLPSELNEVKKEIKALQSEFDNPDLWKVTKVIDMIEKLRYMSPDEKELLSKLIKYSNE